MSESPAFPAPEGGPLFVLLSGLQGSGKSTLGRRLAPLIAATIVSTDAIRRELFPVRTYSDEEHGAVLTEAVRRVEAGLASGRPVIYDATNLMEAVRRPVVEVARQAGGRVIVVQFDLPREIISRRFASRAQQRDEEDLSEAGIEIYDMMVDLFEPVEGDHIRIAADGDIEPALLRVVRLARGLTTDD